MSQARAFNEFEESTCNSGYLSCPQAASDYSGRAVYGHRTDHTVTRRDFISFKKSEPTAGAVNPIADAASDSDDVVAMLKSMGLDAEVQYAEHELASEMEKQAGAPTLKSLRLHKGLSQKALAEALGTVQPRISRLEAGIEEMGLSFASRLADVLDVDVNTIVLAVSAGSDGGR